MSRAIFAVALAVTALAALSLIPSAFGQAKKDQGANEAATADQKAAPHGPDYGPSPELSQPQENWLLPTIGWAKVDPWPEGKTPQAAQGLAVNAFAKGLQHPRWLYVLPNGDVLAAEAASEASKSWSPRAIAQNYVMRQVRSIAESANRITLLRDKNKDGVADERHVFLEGLRQPFGMALIGDKFYVANTDSVVVYDYKEGATRIDGEGKKLMDLKVGHHWTRNILPSKDGTKLYVTVGSGSNIAENGQAEEEGRAAIHELDLATGKSRLFAGGLRNPNGMGLEPQTGTLWTVVNERDELGAILPPDYLTSVQDGGFYGWPWSYWGQNVDERVQPQRSDLVAKAIKPDYALGGHTAALGMTFDEGSKLPAPYNGGAFVGLHGSWNRDQLEGYRVIFLAFKDGKPQGMPVDVLHGFLQGDGDIAHGRPVGVTFDKSGALLVADDAGDAIWRVTGASAVSQTGPGKMAPRN
jgi:glucose/arabinose dehydrogenase